MAGPPWDCQKLPIQLYHIIIVEAASLKDLLREHIELKGLTTGKITEQTGIPERYLEALLNGNAKLLPPAAYVHGYISKLAVVLNFDKDTMWRLYQKEAGFLQAAGASDRLPSNRFAVHYLNKKWLLVLAIALALIIYLGVNIYQLSLPPALAIATPFEENLVLTTPQLIISGQTDQQATLTINGEEVYVKDDGSFLKEYQLQVGLNNFEIKAKKLLSRERRLTRQIIFQPLPTPPASPSLGGPAGGPPPALPTNGQKPTSGERQ